jgi:hypothetical protein
MLSFKQFIQIILEDLAKSKFTHEFIGPEDHDKREAHAHEIHQLLQKSYESIGGLHGSGFKSPEDMKKNIPSWQIAKNSEGKIVAAKMYKHKNGFKSVAMGTDLTEDGKNAAGELIAHAATKKGHWGEVSGKALSFAKKAVSVPLHHMAIPVEQVKKLLPDDEIRAVPRSDPDAQRHPELAKHMYQRKIGDHWHTKFAYGTPKMDKE